METVIYKPNVFLTYNGHNVTDNFSPYLLDVTYTDYEKDQSDELNIRLKDNDGRFRDNWSPRKGDKLSCKMYPQNGSTLDCGSFTIDEVEYSGDESGDICTVRALAATINKSIRTRFTRGYSGKTLVDIAREIGTRHGFEVVGSAGFVYVDTITQANETDLAFLSRVASMYGYTFKLTGNKLVFIPTENLEASDTLLIFNKSNIKSYSFTNTSTKIYGACTASYYDPKKKKLKSFTARNSDSLSKDTLKLTTRYISLDAAKRAALIGLKNGSKEITGTITLKEGNSRFISGVNIELGVNDIGSTGATTDSLSAKGTGNLQRDTGFGIYNGKYHVTQSTHRVSSGVYEVFGEIKKLNS